MNLLLWQLLSVSCKQEFSWHESTVLMSWRSLGKQLWWLILCFQAVLSLLESLAYNYWRFFFFFFLNLISFCFKWNPDPGLIVFYTLMLEKFITSPVYKEFCFFHFGATPAAYGGSQARGWIRAIAVGLHATATETADPSRFCNLHHSSWQHSILNPLSKARNWICVLMDTSQIHFCWATTGTPRGLGFFCLFVFLS